MTITPEPAPLEPSFADELDAAFIGTAWEPPPDEESWAGSWVDELDGQELRLLGLLTDRADTESADMDRTDMDRTGADRFGVDRTGAPAGRLSEVPVGYRLAQALERVVPGSCGPDDLVAVAGAIRRQIAHLEARFHEVVEQLTRTPPDPLAGVDPAVRTADELADMAVGALELELGWSRYRADRVVAQAQHLVAAAPCTLAAMADGVIEADAARVITDTLCLVESPAHRRQVDAAVAAWVRGHAEHGVRRSWSQTRDRVTAAALAVDPKATRKRHEKARADRDLVLRPAPGLDSVADLFLLNAEPHDAALAFSRIDVAARLARSRGDQRTLAQLRADCALGLLAGTATLADVHAPAEPAPATGNVIQPAAEPATEVGAGAAPTAGAGADAPMTGAAAGASPTMGAGSEPETAEPETAVPVADARARIQLDAPLSTYLGLAARPGLLAGLGPIAPDVVRRIVDLHAANPDADCFLGVTHPRTGRLLSLHPVPARFFRGRRRDALAALDRTCAWPTCTRPSADCHADHQDGYAATNTTDPATGQPLCPAHHLRARHREGWRAHRRTAGVTTWTGPYGHGYTDRPDPPPF